MSGHNTTERKHVLMSTAIVEAKGSNGNNCSLRVLLDSMSETNFIALAANKKLGLKLDNTYESINGLNDMNCLIKQGCRLPLKLRISEFS